MQPVGEAGAFWRAAMQAATLANVNRDPKAHPQPYGVEDFLPAAPTEPPTEAEQAAANKARMDSLFSGMGGS